MKTAALLKTYIIIALIYLVLLLFGCDDFAWFLKPLLLPSLIAAVASSEKFASKGLLLCALLFSWFGDIVLLFADKGDMYFIVGLVLFLSAHMLYIVLFLKQPKMQYNKQKGWLYLGALCIIGYLFAMLFVLYPNLGGLKMPVTVYAIIISTMLFMAVKGFFEWKSPANYYILVGAICFITSDSLLAFDKFHNAIPMASFNIMSTYLAAQFCITFGILQLSKKQIHLSEAV